MGDAAAPRWLDLSQAERDMLRVMSAEGWAYPGDQRAARILRRLAALRLGERRSAKRGEPYRPTALSIAFAEKHHA
jgi:hypothetical protein